MDERRVVRRAQVGDAEAIAQVHVGAWRRGYEGIVPTEILDSLSVDQRAEQWRRILGPGEEERVDVTLVSEKGGGRVCGFCTASTLARDPDLGKSVGEIWALYVDPEHWRSGNGRDLMRAAVAWLDRQGCEEAAVWVLKENQRGRDFYAALGFVPDGAEREHDPTGSAEIRLRASLPGDGGAG